MTPRQRILQDISLVAEANRVSMHDIFGPSRYSPVVKARHAAFWLVRFKYRLSLPQIGTIFGRDHTTIYMGIGSHMLRCGINEPLTMLVAAKKRKIALRHHGAAPETELAA